MTLRTVFAAFTEIGGQPEFSIIVSHPRHFHKLENLRALIIRLSRLKMSKTRDNHYVAQWYQVGFFEDGSKNFRYLDLNPEVVTLPDGRTYTAKHKFTSTTSQCFYVTDLYTTVFGEVINDDIERRLFGPIDDWGSRAVRAFIGNDVSEWIGNFQRFFEYIDAQTFRTPKGLDLLKRHYASLNQNELMREMQGIRMMNCTLWSEGIREIVSAEAAGIKFIVSDHPVTIYNYALPPEHQDCAYPNDPPIALKGSQTIFPLNKNLCLILTNLEYAKDPDGCAPTDRRTFARNYRQSMVRADAFIRSRKLNDQEVARINLILKSRAKRFIAAGNEEWLYPEKIVEGNWSDFRSTLLPPKDSRWLFGGEMYAKFESGEVYYQDEFGRTEKPREFLKKSVREPLLRPNDACGCGSGKKYKKCCRDKPSHLRTAWSELSIRERNLTLCRGIVDVLGMNEGKDWVEVRRDLTDGQIARIYSLYEALWPKETDLLALLPKPDGVARALFTGIIDPRTTTEFAVGSGVYFQEVLIESPFLHAGSVNKDFSPVENPKKYHQEFLKSALLTLMLMPLIEDGVVNMIPDPCIFDLHLRDQMFALAEERVRSSRMSLEPDPRTKWLMAEDFKRSMLAMPDDMTLRQIKEAIPDSSESEAKMVLEYQQALREADPLAIINRKAIELGKNGGMLMATKMAPNFEMSVYLARATGAFIVTDSELRWQELLNSQNRQQGMIVSNAPEFSRRLQGIEMRFVRDANAVASMRREGKLAAHRVLMQEAFDYANSAQRRGKREKLDARLASRLSSINTVSQRMLQGDPSPYATGRMRCAMPMGGLNHNNVSRMLLTSGSQYHTDNVPFAFFIETTDSGAYQQDLM